jgi:hypothetical protein
VGTPSRAVSSTQVQARADAVRAAVSHQLDEASDDGTLILENAASIEAPSEPKETNREKDKLATIGVEP